MTVDSATSAATSTAAVVAKRAAEIAWRAMRIRAPAATGFIRFGFIRSQTVPGTVSSTHSPQAPLPYALALLPSW